MQKEQKKEAAGNKNTGKKNSKGLRIFLIIVIVVAACVLAVSVYKLISIKNSYKVASDYYDQVADVLTSGKTDTADHDAGAEEGSDAAVNNDAAAASAVSETTAADVQNEPEMQSEDAADVLEDSADQTVSADVQEDTAGTAADPVISESPADEAASSAVSDDTEVSEVSAEEITEVSSENTDTPAAQTAISEIKPVTCSLYSRNAFYNSDWIKYKSINFNYDALLELCEDGVGYIYQKDTVISYPVVQGEDNDQYLRHLMNGDYSVGGTLFVDYRYEDGLNSQYSIIYGHNMDDKSMFGSITSYKDEEYYREHPEFELYVGDDAYVYYVYAAAQVPLDSPVFTFTFKDGEFLELMEEIKELNEYEIDIPVKITENSKVTVLSTCIDYPRDYNYRYIVVLVRGFKLQDKE